MTGIFSLLLVQIRDAIGFDACWERLAKKKTSGNHYQPNPSMEIHGEKYQHEEEWSPKKKSEKNAEK